MSQKVEDFLQAKIEKGFFTGASVVFGRPGEKKIRLHRGTLSKKLPMPVNDQTVFDLQSMTKALVTAPLFLKLQKESRLMLSTRVSQCLGSTFPLKEASAANASLGQLLTHSAGFSDQDMTGSFKTAYELWHTIFTAPRHYEPGTSIEYADASFRVLGKVIETIMGMSLETASKQYLIDSSILGSRHRELSYLPLDPFNVVACGDAHGTIDDDHVRLLGQIVGCDGLFGSAEAIFDQIASYMSSHPAIGEPIGPLLIRNTFAPKAKIESFFDALSKGPKRLGWEMNPSGYSYAGKFRSDATFEKSGGAGTFIWFDQETQFICVYLTNHGKPKPFKPKKWNQLIEEVGPHQLGDLLYEERGTIGERVADHAKED